MFTAAGLDEDLGVNNAEEGFGGQVAGLLAMQGGEIRAEGVVLVVFRPDIVVY